MSLWGNIDYSSGNNKPKYANTSNVQSNSTIHGTKANTTKYYGVVFGVSAAEAANSLNPHIVHPGWVSQKIGTGPISTVGWSGGTGYNGAGYLRVTDTSVLGSGTGANISYTTANAQNVMESYSSNSQLNVINSITVVLGGTLYSQNSKITVEGPKAISNATFTVKLGGRGDRVSYETLVAMGSITGDDPRDNSTFVGI